MKNNTQVVLFFEQNSIYNPTKVASKIVDAFEEIGSSIILPINNSAPEEVNIPYLVFNQNQNFQIIANFKNVSVILAEEFEKKLLDIVVKIYDIFSQENAFVRIGYIPTEIKPIDNIEKIKKDIFKDEEIQKCEEFNLSWFKTIKILDKDINCWKRYVKDSKQFDGLLVSHDFNTRNEEQTTISKEFIKDFIDNCNSNK